jgi:hypothetical protein
MEATAVGRTTLTLVKEPTEPEPLVSFCSHCADRVPTPAVAARVCPKCGLGVMLEADAELAPREAAAFLVLDGAMSVCAVSRAAETLLGTSETDAVNHHLSELLSVADVESVTTSSLAAAISSAARGRRDSHQLVLRPANFYGVRLQARLGSCGPRPAALIVFE